MSSVERFWDGTLKPKLSELLKKFDETDKLSHYYLGQAMFYVEHDLADGRDPRFRLMQCGGVFNEESFRNIAEFADFKDLIKEAGEMIDTIIGLEYRR